MNYCFLKFVNEMITFKVSGFLARIVSGIEGVQAGCIYNVT